MFLVFSFLSFFLKGIGKGSLCSLLLVLNVIDLFGVRKRILFPPCLTPPVCCLLTGLLTDSHCASILCKSVSYRVWYVVLKTFSGVAVTNAQNCVVSVIDRKGTYGILQAIRAVSDSKPSTLYNQWC